MPRTGRPRAFDEHETLARARDLFWSHGYGATSVQDLVDALRVQRGSLYGAFGDKRTLYLRAVSLYAQENMQQLESLLATGPVLPTLRLMLTHPATLTGADPTAAARRGCLVGNTTAELVPDDADAQAVVAAAYDGFVRVVASAIRRAQAAGEVAATRDPETTAHMILLLFQGSALVSRANADRRRSDAAIDAALSALRDPHAR